VTIDVVLGTFWLNLDPLNRLSSFGLIFLSMAFGSGIVSAQDYEKVAPKTPPKATPTNFLQTNSNLGSLAEAVSLNGVVIFRNPQDVREAGIDSVTGIEIRGIDYLKNSKFREQLGGYLNHPITSKSVEILVRDIVLYSQLHQHPSVYVVVPKQNYSAGVLQIVVLENVPGKIEGDAEQEFENADLFARLKTEDAERSKLEDHYWININPDKNLNDPDNKILVRELKGLVFMSGTDQVKPGGLKNVHGVRAFSFGILRTPEFYGKVRSYFGEPVSLGVIKKLTKDVILYFRENDRPVVDVFVPEQDITTGVIQVVVLEGRLGEVRAEGHKWFAPGRFTGAIRLQSEEYISEEVLTEDLNWLNSNPFRQTTAAFTPGKTPGYTDLILKTKDKFPVRVFGGFEDSGNDLTGDERVLFGVNWGNVMGLDHQASYQFTSDLDFEKIVAHSGSYLVPLPWRHRWSIFGSYAETSADISNILFDLKGTSWQASTRYTAALPTIQTYHHELSGGFDFKQSNNNLEFGGSQVFNTVTEVNQFVLDYSSSLQDSLGVNSFNISGFFSPGGISSRNNDLLFQASRASSKAAYMYGKFAAERLTRLPYDFTWALKASAQLSTDNLLGSEQFGLGGYSSVRGYEEREANGDEGYFLSTEFRSPPLSINWLLDREEKFDQLQLLAFFDYGATQNKFLLTGEDPHVQLASAGPGLRYAVGSYLTFRFDYGWQFYPTGLNQRFDSRGHMGLVLSY
jgi:hemolysin activation/secretion protein